MTRRSSLEVYRREDGRWAWRFRAPNGEIIATDGGQGYEHKSDCEAMASRVVTNGRILKVVTVDA